MKNWNDKVNQILTDNSGVKTITSSQNIFIDLGMDSLDHITAIMELEEEFEIEIDDADCEKWTTVQDIYDYGLNVK